MSRLYKTIINLKNFNQNFENKKFRFVAFNNIFNNKNLFLYHFTTHKDFLHDPYRNILINYFNKAEKLYPGGSFLLSKEIVDQNLKRKNDNFKLSDVTLDNLKKLLLQDFEKNEVNNFLNILSFSGPDAIINCKTTKNSQFTVEKNKNPFFEINLHEDFIKTYFSNQQTLTKNYLTCIYDGFVERESELYSLIEKSKENNNAPVLLVCRGISDYAVKHLKQVLVQNRIILMPYICKFNNDDPFIFEDMCKCLNIKPFNIESGDNIYKKLSENAEFKKIKLSLNKIEILEKINYEFINELNGQIKSSPNDESLRKYLFKRKNRSYPNIVNISIPETSIYLLNVYKSMLKIYNCVVKEGIISNEDKLFSYFLYYRVKKLCNSLHKNLLNLGLTIKIKDKKNAR